MNPSEDPSDRLVDSLLREQARGKADDALLQSIAAKLDAVPPLHAASRPPTWRPLLATAAAVVILCAGTATWIGVKESQHKRREMAASSNSLSAGVGELVLDDGYTGPQTPAPQVDFSIPPPPQREVAPVPPLEEQKADSSIASMDAAAADPFGSAAPPAESPMEDILAEASPSVGATLAAKRGGQGQGSGSALGGAAALTDRAEAPLANAGMPVKPAAARLGKGKMPMAPGISPEFGFDLRGRVNTAAEEQSDMSRENYGRLVDQPWKSPWQEALSTFSIDVDTASYTNLRRMILDGRTIPADAVRIEECLNYFDYKYEGPKGEGPFAVHGNLATCPWKPGHLLARVAIKGREMDAKARPASNLVFLIDVSGSMQDPAKLPLLKRSIRVLIDQLDERDRVGMVVYAGSEGVVLEPTLLDERGKSRAIQALEKLEAGGSTNGGAGIKRAYELARKYLVEGGTNRVILATDGDFNVGTTGQGDLVNLVKNGSGGRIYLSVLGFGTGNLNDAMLEAITKDGNGNYFYIDGDNEARRVFLQKLTGTLVTIAKDVKIQVEFNPGKVQAYRLIGYANRILRHEDFANDTVDAGDIGAGHTVTAFYEIVPDSVPMPDTGSIDALRYQRPAGKEVVASEDWFTLKLRHKHPEGDVSSLIETPVRGGAIPWEEAGNDFRFASAVALFGMKLRQMPEMADFTWAKIREIAKPALAEDPQEQRAGFVELLDRLKRLDPVAAAEATLSAEDIDGTLHIEFEGLRYVREEATKWYVAFGEESDGKWKPWMMGQNENKRHFGNKNNPKPWFAPGDVFFKDGPMAGRFRFLGFSERQVVNRRTMLSQIAKVAEFEDLKPNKKGVKYESQYGLPEAEIDALASYDRTAVFEVRGQEGKELRVEERTNFTLPSDPSGRSYFLKRVTPESVIVESTGPGGATRSQEIQKAVVPAADK